VTRPPAVMTASCLAMLTLSFSVAGPAMCMPAMARDLHLGYAEQGLLFSAPMWPFALPLLAAALADRVGFRGLLLLACVTQAAGWLLLAEARSFHEAIGAAVLAGIGGSILEPLLTPMVCAVYPERRAKMANFLHAFYCVGLVGVALGVAFLVPAGLTWRWTFRGLGVLCVPYGLASAILALPAQAHRGPVRLKARTLARQPVFWLLALTLALAAATELGPGNWLPSFVESLAPAGGGPDARLVPAGLGLALFGALMAAGRLATSALGSRLGVPRLLMLAAAVSTVCLAAVALPLGTVWRISCLGLVGFAVACFWPTLLAVAGDRFPQAGASMFSVLSTVGGMGCAAAPAALGYLAGVLGSLAPAIACLAVAPALILVAGACLRRT